MPPTFGGGDKCAVCTKTVYTNEKTTFEGKHYHGDCFTCGICKKKIDSAAKAGAMNGNVVHRMCFEKEFRTSGGKYGGVAVVAGAKAEADKKAEAEKKGETFVGAAAPVLEKKEEPKPLLGANKNTHTPANLPQTEKKAEPAKKEEAKKVEVKMGTTEEKADKVYIENYSKVQTEPVVYKCELVDGKPKVGVFIGKCSGCTIKIEGKAKNITISGCDQANILFDNCVTTVEVINSKRCNIQAAESAGTFMLDKCDRTKVYLPAASCKDGNRALVYTTQSGSTVVHWETPNGEDMKEYGCPEQILQSFQIGKPPTCIVVIPESDEKPKLKADS